MKTLGQLKKAMLANDFYSFIQLAFYAVAPGERFVPDVHILTMAYWLRRAMDGKVRRLIINVPPRSLKSISASVALPAFALGHNPSRKIICVSYAESLSRKFMRDFRALIGSPAYRAVFPNMRVAEKDSQNEVMTTKRGFRMATSIDGTLTGRGGDLVIIDDPQKPQDAMSQIARDRTKEWFANTLLSRLDDRKTGTIIVVMQRLHTDDLTGYLLDQGGWEHVCLPAIAESEQEIQIGDKNVLIRPKGDVLHARRDSLESLEEIRAAMGSMAFAAQYQQAPVPAEGAMIKDKWIKTFDKPPIVLPNDHVIISWDTAMSGANLADYSVGLVLLKRGETIYLLEVVRERFEYPDLKRAVIRLHQRWRSVTARYSLLIEDQGSGKSLIQDLRAQHVHAIPMKPEGDKIMRMAAQTPRLEAGVLHVPEKAPWLDLFRKEILEFPGGRNDDQVDALSQALKHLSDRSLVPVARIGRYGVRR